LKLPVEQAWAYVELRVGIRHIRRLYGRRPPPGHQISAFASVDRNNVLITLGLRLKSPTYGRVSIYGAFGGFGTYSRVETVVN
jgi:hypothetical protein